MPLYIFFNIILYLIPINMKKETALLNVLTHVLFFCSAARTSVSLFWACNLYIFILVQVCFMVDTFYNTTRLTSGYFKHNNIHDFKYIHSIFFCVGRMQLITFNLEKKWQPTSLLAILKCSSLCKGIFFYSDVLIVYTNIYLIKTLDNN